MHMHMTILSRIYTYIHVYIYIYKYIHTPTYTYILELTAYAQYRHVQRCCPRHQLYEILSLSADSCPRYHLKTSRASVAQLVRARDCQSVGRRFDSVKNPTTQIPMNLNFIDPQTRVLNYF